MAALALGPEIFGYVFRLLPTPEEAVTYYLPRLVAGNPLHAAVRPVVHHADVYASAPADLARHFRPLPKTGDRFFFSPKRAPGAAQASRGGSWQAQNTADIKTRRGGDADAKVGELRKLRYKNRGGGGYTDWLMDEYSSCSGDGESQFVLCKMYVSPRAAPTSAAYKESAAYFFTLSPPPPATLAAAFMQPAPAPAAAPKRPAPPRLAMSPPCAKRMRVPPELLARPAQSPAPPAPTLSSRTAIQNMPFAPPQLCAPRRGSATPLTTQLSPASAPPPAPPAPTRTPLAALLKLPIAPPQPSCAPRRGSTTPLATQPSPVSAPLLAPPAPIRRSPTPLPTPPQPLPQQVPPLLPNPPVPVVRTCHVPLQVPVVQSKQRRILDPFEAAMLRDEAEEQTVAAAPQEDEDEWDDLEKALEFE